MTKNPTDELFSTKEDYLFFCCIFLFMLAGCSYFLGRFSVLALLPLIVFPFSRTNELNFKFNSFPIVTIYLIYLAINILLSDHQNRAFLFMAQDIPILLFGFVIYRHCISESRILLVFFAMILFCIIILIWLIITPIYTDLQAGRDFNDLLSKWWRVEEWVAYADIPWIVTKNDTIWFALLTPFAIYFSLNANMRVVKITSIAFIALTMVCISIYNSRGALLTISLATCMTLFLIGRAGTLRWALLIIFGIVAIDLLTNQSLISKTSSLLTRFQEALESGWPISLEAWGMINPRFNDLWLPAWSAFLERPILGHGLHSFAYLGGAAPWPHNIYLEVLCEQGIVGTALIGALLARCLVTLLRPFRSDSSTLRDAGRLLLCCFAGFGFAGIFELTLLREWLTLMLSVLISASLIFGGTYAR